MYEHGNGEKSPLFTWQGCKKYVVYLTLWQKVCFLHGKIAKSLFLLDYVLKSGLFVVCLTMV